MRLIGQKIYFIICGLLFLAACTSNNCGNTVCLNQGLCVDGRCTCPTGYEGTMCDTVWNEKFVGTWQVTDTVLDTTASLFSSYQIHVSSNGLAGGFYIDSITGYTSTVSGGRADSLNASISGPMTFSMVSKYSTDSSFRLESGSGRLYTDGHIGATMRYSVNSKSYSLYSGWIKQ